MLHTHVPSLKSLSESESSAFMMAFGVTKSSKIDALCGVDPEISHCTVSTGLIDLKATRLSKPMTPTNIASVTPAAKPIDRQANVQLL